MGSLTGGAKAVRHPHDLVVCRRLHHRRVMRRAVLVVAFGLILGACTSGAGEPVGPDDGSVSVDTVTLPSLAPVTDAVTRPPLMPEGADVLAIPEERFTRMWERPAHDHSAFTFDMRNPHGQLTPLLIADAKRREGRAWFEVLLPIRPNGVTAWVREKDITLREAHQRIEVDLSERVLRYFVHDRLEQRLRVGVGTDATPTGTGRFYVWVKVRYSSPYQPYGIAALGLSGFSPVLSEWPGGGRMAIHGTSSPTDRGRAVSHGCVRVLNEELKLLLDVPLGTPVEIRR